MNNNMTYTIETLLTDRDVAAILKVDRQTVRRLTNEGKIHRLKIGRSVRYEQQAIAEYIESCRDLN